MWCEVQVTASDVLTSVRLDATHDDGGLAQRHTSVAPPASTRIPDSGCFGCLLPSEQLRQP